MNESSEEPLSRREAQDLMLRVTALEYVLTEIGKMTLLDAGISPQAATEMRTTTRKTLLGDPFPGDDPVLADHVGAEFADRVDDLLRRIETLVADSYLKAPRPRS